MKAVFYSSASDEWPTPQWLFDALNAEFGFTLDPCATPENAKCPRFYTSKENGLTQDWGRETVFMNPPYGRSIEQWMHKAFEASQRGALVVAVVPSRTDTRWFHRYALRGEVRPLKGRVRFEGGKHSAPFPTAIVVFRPFGYALCAS